MKRIFHLMTALVAVFLMFSCTPKGVCVIEGRVDAPQYGSICMVGMMGEVLDSTSRSSDGSFGFVYDKVEEMPRMAIVEFRNPEAPEDRMFLPVALEAGEVNVAVGEYISLSGTPLNARIQDFFDSMQALADGFDSEVSTVDAKTAAYSAFYLKQMQDNDDNVFGDYLKLAYARCLTPADLAVLQEE